MVRNRPSTSKKDVRVAAEPKKDQSEVCMQEQKAVFLQDKWTLVPAFLKVSL